MNFFDYMNLAKKEHRSLIEAYLELETLSVRELEVFDRLLTDKTLSQIAEELFLSYSSVHFHCKNIYRKLKLSSRRPLLIVYKDLCQ